MSKKRKPDSFEEDKPKNKRLKSTQYLDETNETSTEDEQRGIDFDFKL